MKLIKNETILITNIIIFSNLFFYLLTGLTKCIVQFYDVNKHINAHF